MALIEQDPVNPITFANSYQSLSNARVLAGNSGVTLPDEDADAEKSLIDGFYYIESRESQMRGTRATSSQVTSWPRSGACIRGNEFPSDAFPAELLLSQIIAAESFGNGNNLWGSEDNGRVVTKEKLDALETEYADNGKTGSSIYLPRLESTIQPLLSSSATLTQFSVSRA